jgi:tRNA(fMet)-specific endonuclease VapC
MYILDTDTLTHLYAGNINVIQNLRNLDSPDISTTLITKAEMLRGRIEYLLKANTATDIQRAQQLFNITENLLSQIPIVSFDQSAVIRFEQFSSQSNLRKIGRADMLIASITLSQRATLITRNLQHFRQFPGLKVLNWVD